MPNKLYPLIVILMLGACTMFGPPPELPQPPLEELPDIQLFSSEACATACWQGLRPGETVTSEVTQLLETSPFAIDYVSSNDANASLIFADHSDGYDVVAVTTEGSLHHLAISDRFLRLTIGEVIDALGEPEAVLIVYDPGTEVVMDNVNLTLYYPDQGYAFELRNSEGLSGELVAANEVKVCVSEDALVTRVFVTQVGSISDMLGYINFPYTVSNMFVDRLTEWTGFGCVHMPWN